MDYPVVCSFLWIIRSSGAIDPVVCFIRWCISSCGVLSCGVFPLAVFYPVVYFLLRCIQASQSTECWQGTFPVYECWRLQKCWVLYQRGFPLLLTIQEISQDLISQKFCKFGGILWIYLIQILELFIYYQIGIDVKLIYSNFIFELIQNFYYNNFFTT